MTVPNKELLPGISVIICCYNSAWIIARCLDALKRQTIQSGFHWEIILVDNNCTDDTVQIATSIMNGSSIDFRIVKESEAGLAYARVRGVTEAKYEYIVFCDDDNLLCPLYLSTAYAILEAHPEIGAVGGKGVAEFECEPDPRILSKIEGYAVGSQISHKNWLFGAGMTLRTHLVQDIYTNQKRYLVGRKGGELLSGDDSELAYSVVLRGYKTFPTDDISYIHVLRTNRLTWAYCTRMYSGFSKADGALMIMRLVLEDGRFGEFIRQYLNHCIKFVKCGLMFWRSKSKEGREKCRQWIANVNYWGIVKLYSIYREWTCIKQHYASGFGKDESNGAIRSN